MFEDEKIKYPDARKVFVDTRCCVLKEEIVDQDNIVLEDIYIYHNTAYFCGKNSYSDLFGELPTLDIAKKNFFLTSDTDSQDLIEEKICENYTLRVARNKKKLSSAAYQVCKIAKNKGAGFINNHLVAKELTNMDCSRYASLVYDSFNPDTVQKTLNLYEKNSVATNEKIRNLVCQSQDGFQLFDNIIDENFSLTSNKIKDENSCMQETDDINASKCLNCNNTLSKMYLARSKAWSSNSVKSMFYGSLIFVAGSIVLAATMALRSVPKFGFWATRKIQNNARNKKLRMHIEEKFKQDIIKEPGKLISDNGKYTLSDDYIDKYFDDWSNNNSSHKDAKELLQKNKQQIKESILNDNDAKIKKDIPKLIIEKNINLDWDETVLKNMVLMKKK